MEGEIKEYTLSIQSRGGGYSSIKKTMTRAQFEAYYDKVVANGGKVIGIF
tara:strand:- start:319 stop:468 length:150 start_codon:yes stop_codon:yes gene_type:complete